MAVSTRKTTHVPAACHYLQPSPIVEIRQVRGSTSRYVALGRIAITADIVLTVYQKTATS